MYAPFFFKDPLCFKRLGMLIFRMIVVLVNSAPLFCRLGVLRVAALQPARVFFSNFFFLVERGAPFRCFVLE